MYEREARERLRAHVRARREAVVAYVERMGPRGERLANISIIATGLAAIFTAGPALGGARFSGALQRAFALETDDVIYQVLCLAALLGAVVAAITVNLVKRQHIGTRVGTAESVAGELEILETALEFESISIEDAVKQYQNCIQKISFIPEVEETTAHGPLPPGVPPTPMQASGSRSQRGRVPPPGWPYPPRPSMPPRPPRPPAAGGTARGPRRGGGSTPSETVIINPDSESPSTPEDGPTTS